jgi:hypothetical protein
MSLEPERVHGWKDIAATIEISVRAAQERAQRSFDPLPVRIGHRGPWAHTNALRDWVMRQDVAYPVALQLHRRAARGAHARARR